MAAHPDPAATSGVELSTQECWDVLDVQSWVVIVVDNEQKLGQGHLSLPEDRVGLR